MEEETDCENKTYAPQSIDACRDARRTASRLRNFLARLGVSQIQQEEKTMARYSRSASTDVKRAMKRRKAGTLKSGRSGETVKSKRQAIAIGLSEARAKGKKVPRKKSA
jgi:hypothetical protein